MGDMRGLLRFSFVFYIYCLFANLTGWSRVSDSGHYLTTGFSRFVTFNPHVFVQLFRWLKTQMVELLIGFVCFVNFPFWMRLGVRYHCYYLYSVVCQHIWRNVWPLFFPRFTGVKKTQNYKLFISNPIVLFWRTKKKNFFFFFKWKGMKEKKRYVGFFLISNVNFW